jgi:DNA-binding XRE family transcriptional regulator
MERGSRSNNRSHIESPFDVAFKQGASKQHTPIAYGLQDVEQEVGRRIKALRQGKGITQDELAEIAGVNRVHLYRIETGRQSMTLRTLKIIADALGVRVRDLVKNL